MPPGSQPLVGHSLTILGVKNSGTTLREWIKQFGPTLRVVGPFWSDHLIMMKPEHLEKVLGKDSAHEYPKVGPGVAFESVRKGNTIVYSPVLCGEHLRSCSDMGS
ncbi:hypothetical protein M378DRAFT_589893 [Amanita muscaria Koide BX008]|uniref:Uncharacterized protein n=1 Tax=Amanita muscaria (strain Koide BX008) TaxID=946122 RepID=A0A0C2X705_AMAMK|nr:hypothetical protein M378DRAFT_589893 [Amanita muscaria Koide BX008]